MRLRSVVLSASLLLVSCLASGSNTVQAADTKTVAFAPFKDPWASARERYWDIADNQYNAFINAVGTSSEFKYSNANVTLTYDPAPSVPYFVGRIQASGLKPNFLYQLKLTGKPARGRRGWKSYGDDWSNDVIGYAGRWWCDSSHSTQTNFNDSHYEAYYDNATTGSEHDIYGYQFMGSFVTDRLGNADVQFTGQSSYHVNWKGTQLSSSQKSNTSAFVLNPASPFSVSSTSPHYGYGSSIPNRSVSLWYEYEAGRAKDNVQLPAGRYNCRFLLTEESFHNTSYYGGYWKTVLATEDFATDAFGAYLTDAQGNLVPDSNTANDVRFVIGLPTAPPNLTASAGDARVDLAWSESTNATSYTLKRAAISGGPYSTIATNLSGTGYSDTNVENGKTYYYIVVAVNNAGESTPSNEAAATPQSTPVPASPTNLIATPVSNQVDLSWTASVGATSYNVKRSETTGGPYTTLATGVTVTHYTDKDVVAGRTYYYVVTANNSSGESENSDEASTTAEQVMVAAPSISPNGGTYFGSVTVTLGTTTSGAQIRYTTNGSDPTSSSTLYTGSFNINASVTLKARAFLNGGASSISTATFTINQTLTVPPNADAYVRNGKSYATKNYGNATTLEVKTSKTQAENRDAYLRFDLTGVSSIASAKLRIYATLTGTGSGTSVGTTAYAVSNTTWSENAITWNNKPSRGNSLGSTSVTKTAATWYELDVTSYVRNELSSGRRIVSLALHNQANSNLVIAIASRETGNAPQLLLTK